MFSHIKRRAFAIRKRIDAGYAHKLQMLGIVG
jgi:hypothetical protein